MPTAKGSVKVQTYINHLVNAQKLLDDLPDRFYRAKETNDLLNNQREQLEKLVKEMTNAAQEQKFR